MRDLAEKNVEHAHAAYNQLMDAMTQSLTMWTKVAPANQITSGFSDAQDRATKFAKRNADAAFALASDLAKAKDIPEVFDIQSRYAQSQMQAFAAQAKELTQLMTKAAVSFQTRQ